MPIGIFKEKSSSKSKTAGMSKQRQTALAVVDALNNKDIRGVMEMRSRSCWREIYPLSLGAKPQDDKQTSIVLNMMVNFVTSYHMSVYEIIEDKSARKVCLWLDVKGKTKAGPFSNEYVWSMEFDETGTQIVRWKEFADSISTFEVFPELMGAEESLGTSSPTPRTGTPTAESQTATTTYAGSTASGSSQDPLRRQTSATSSSRQSQ